MVIARELSHPGAHSFLAARHWLGLVPRELSKGEFSQMQSILPFEWVRLLRVSTFNGQEKSKSCAGRLNQPIDVPHSFAVESHNRGTGSDSNLTSASQHPPLQVVEPQSRTRSGTGWDVTAFSVEATTKSESNFPNRSLHKVTISEVLIKAESLTVGSVTCWASAVRRRLGIPIPLSATTK